MRECENAKEVKDRAGLSPRIDGADTSRVASGDLGAGSAWTTGPALLSDWEYIDSPISAEYAVTWARLRCRTVRVQMPIARWRLRWRVVCLDGHYIDGVYDSDGELIPEDDLLVRRYDRFGHLYDPARNHGRVSRSWITSGVPAGRKQDLDAYKVDFLAAGEMEHHRPRRARNVYQRSGTRPRPATSAEHVSGNATEAKTERAYEDSTAPARRSVVAGANREQD